MQRLLIGLVKQEYLESYRLQYSSKCLMKNLYQTSPDSIIAKKTATKKPKVLDDQVDLKPKLVVHYTNKGAARGDFSI